MNQPDAGDHVLNIALSTTESAVRIAGDGAANLVLLLTALLKKESANVEKRIHPGRVRLREFLKNNAESSVFRLKYSDMPTFRNRAKAYGFQFYVAKDSAAEKKAKSIADEIKKEFKAKIKALDKNAAGYEDKAAALEKQALEQIRQKADFEVDILVPAAGSEQPLV